MNPGFSPMDTDAQPERLLSVWLTHYEQAIAALSQPADSPQTVLAALLCRDRVEAALQAQGPTVDELMMLDHLDAQFKTAVGQGREAGALDRWRSLFYRRLSGILGAGCRRSQACRCVCFGKLG